MVSSAWVASKLNPYAAWLKGMAIAAAGTALVGIGWTANGWRLGKNIAQLETSVARKEAARQTALNERTQKAMADALGAVTVTQEALKEARRTNAALVAKASQNAPKGLKYACRDEALPEDYLEDFRQ